MRIGRGKLVSAGVLGIDPPGKIRKGGIICEARLIECVSEYDSEWFTGPYGFVLADVREVSFMPRRGRLGFWDLEKQGELWKRNRI